MTREPLNPANQDKILLTSLAALFELHIQGEGRNVIFVEDDEYSINSLKRVCYKAAYMVSQRYNIAIPSLMMALEQLNIVTVGYGVDTEQFKQLVDVLDPTFFVCHGSWPEPIIKIFEDQAEKIGAAIGVAKPFDPTNN